MPQPAQKQRDSDLRRVAVAVDVPLRRLFEYRVPKALGLPEPGARVRIPFGRRTLTGLVWSHPDADSEAPSGLRDVIAVIDTTPLFSRDDLALIQFAAEYYHHPPGEVVAAALAPGMRTGGDARAVQPFWSVTDAGLEVDLEALARRAKKQAALIDALTQRGALDAGALNVALKDWRRVAGTLVERGWITVEDRDTDGHWPEPFDGKPGPELGAAQREALTAITAQRSFGVTLIDGVTGSGKTEVYLHAIRECIARGQQALVLVPEIGLTPQLARRFERRLGRRVALLHSELSDGERTRNWLAARSGAAEVILGTRSAVFAPLARPGLIIVDEEHDPSLKQHEGFRYHARDLAVWRARQLDVRVALGSATPSLESLDNARAGRYQRAVMAERAGGARAPSIRVIDLNRHVVDDGLSHPARTAIAAHLDGGQQVLVYINRRGFAPTLICTGCGKMAECTYCDARVTLHLGRNIMQCHHCGAVQAVPKVCDDCGEPLRALGEGTERVEQALSTAFPAVGIARIDSDTTQAKGSRDALLESARTGDARLLVGTQMLAKGHHLPDLTLVVIVNADQGFFASDFRAAERLAQSVLQVAGRAGRAEVPGEVLIQSHFPQHPLLVTLVNEGYGAFAQAALEERAQAGWPPYSHLAVVHAAAREPNAAQAFLDQVKKMAQAPGVTVLGPAPAAMQRRAGLHRFQLLLQSRERGPLHGLLHRLAPALEAARAPKGLRWSIDVDPQAEL
ncbi:MAG: primosomal protein N' [Pseudomonadota bacterium]